MSRCLTLALFALCVSNARADEPKPLYDGSHWNWPKLIGDWKLRACWCPNDYRAKTMPKTCPNASGCVDDYRQKSLPCAVPNAKGCVDDYSPKTCPLTLGKLFESWYSCGSNAGPCASGKK
jgi:hypothetical protein